MPAVRRSHSDTLLGGHARFTNAPVLSSHIDDKRQHASAHTRRRYVLWRVVAAAALIVFLLGLWSTFPSLRSLATATRGAGLRQRSGMFEPTAIHFSSSGSSSSVRSRDGHISSWDFSAAMRMPQLSKPEAPHSRIYNPSMVRLPNGTLLVYARQSTGNMCPGYLLGKYVEPESLFHGIVGATYEPGTMRQVGRSFDVVFPTRTRSGSDIRCDQGTESVPDHAPAHLQDVRMFWLKGRLAVLVLVMNCEEVYGYANSRQYLGYISLKTGRPEVGGLVAVALDPNDVHRRDHDAKEGLAYQKNWVPFVAPADGALYLEYGVEPRVVLRVNATFSPGSTEGVAQARSRRSPTLIPVHPITSHPDLFLRQQNWGATVRGSAPAVLLRYDRPELRGLGLAPGSIRSKYPHGIYLSLAHLLMPTKVPYYRHVFVLFDAAAPFRVVSSSAPFELPPLLMGYGPNRRLGPPAVQFVTSVLLLEEDEGRRGAVAAELLIGYGEQDCQGGFVRLSLRAALEAAASDLAWAAASETAPQQHAAVALVAPHFTPVANGRTLSSHLRDPYELKVGGKLAHALFDFHLHGEWFATAEPEFMLSQCKSACIVVDVCTGFEAYPGTRDLSRACRLFIAPRHVYAANNNVTMTHASFSYGTAETNTERPPVFYVKSMPLSGGDGAGTHFDILKEQDAACAGCPGPTCKCTKIDIQ